MIEVGLILITTFAFFYAMIAGKLSRGVVTPPMAAIGIGLITALFLGAQGAHLEGALHIIAEVTLVVVLFSDAAMVKFRILRQGGGISLRMLIIGLPLTIGLGYLLNMWLLPDWPVWELALLASILAPTDAALGLAVVTNPKVPQRLRSSLIVESGFNDGLALPAVLFFGCLAVNGVHDNVQTPLVVFVAEQVGIGVVVGAVVGAVGGWMMTQAMRRELTNEVSESIAVLALAALCYLGASYLGGNGFLSAFVGGITFGLLFERRNKFVLEFLETESQLFVLGTFVLLGIVVAPELSETLSPIWFVIIFASLFIVRPLAIWISLLGSSTTQVERIFLGWFGPRGLATVLFALLVLDDFNLLKKGDEILMICFLAVLISAVLHGVSAAPVAAQFRGELKPGEAK